VSSSATMKSKGTGFAQSDQMISADKSGRGVEGQAMGKKVGASLVQNTTRRRVLGKGGSPNRRH